MTSKCESCRNCFADCQSEPTFIDEDKASAENLPLDIVVECDAYVPEELPNLCAACVNHPETCGGEVSPEGKCSCYTDEEYDDSEDDDFWGDDDDDDDFEGDEDLAERDPTWDDDE